jgi:phosphatidylinositol alpha-mannosyltransferase
VRVALVSPYSVTLPGGVQGQVLGIAAALARAGDEVVVVAPGEPDAVPAGGLAGGARLALVGRTLPIPVNGSRAPVALSPGAALRSRAELRASRPDVVHVHEPFVPGPALAALLARPAPTLGTFHRSGASAPYRVLRPLLGPLLGRLDDAVAVSEAARATVEAVAGRRAQGLAVLANGVDLERFERAVPFRADRPAAVFVGRHEARKGLGVLLEAFSSSALEASLWVVGDGPEHATLRARYGADRRIEWLGRLDGDALASRVAGAAVLVAPSLGGESFGVVLLEAMAAGAAVLASDIPGYRSAAGAAAEFVAPGDPVALRRALETMLGDGGRRAELVRAGRERARSHSFEALAAAYRRRYEVLLSGVPRGVRSSPPGTGTPPGSDDGWSSPYTAT